jgi:hypothetical protein
MLNRNVLAALSLGLAAAACAGPYDRQAPVPSAYNTPYNTSRAATQSERTCIDYGFSSGTASFDRCVQREARSREAGRVNRDYAEARLLDDSRNACYDYGLTRGTQRYETCVSREVDARRYREQSQTPVAPRSYAPEYYVPANAPPPAPDYYTPARTQMPYAEPRAASTGVQTFQDEFGFRYDSQGNRLDRYGNIISPASTTR